MSKIFDAFVNLLGFVFNGSYKICNNYGLAIIIFTVLSKILLFPINILIQKNSIKMIKMRPKIDELKLKYDKDKDAFMEAQIELFEKEKYHPTVGVLPLLIQIPIILGLIQVIRNPDRYIENLTNTLFFNINLSAIPVFWSDMVIPILAGITTVLLILFQNKFNVLQKEESFFSKILTAMTTIILTVYFVFVVPNGVGIYWSIGNVLAIIQLFILNYIFPPKKYVDYEYLEQVKKKSEEKKKKDKISKNKSKYYYKKFFDEKNIENMKLVFYSEGSGFFKYYKKTIEYILNNSDINIHYITSDINDKIFEYDNKKIIPYYIDTSKLIPLFMKLEADIVVMTTPDLQNLYLKRSIIKKDIEYIFKDHGIGSKNLLYRANALEHYDTIFAVNEKQVQEIRELEKLKNTKEKKIIEAGYPLIEELIEQYEKNKVVNEEKVILIAPSWQDDNIIDSCLEEMLEKLLLMKYKVIVRPHPQYMKRTPEKIDLLENKYKEYVGKKIFFEKDFSSNENIYNADLLITDWSGIGYEFSLATTKPCLFINTKMKVLNPNYQDISVVPLDIEIREKIGINIEKNEVKNIGEYIEKLILNQEEYIKNNKMLREKYIFNLGKSSEVEGKYIIERLKGEKK